MPLPSLQKIMLAALLFAAYALFGYWLDSYRLPRWYQEFHRARLGGVVYRRDGGKGRVTLRLTNDPQTYSFFPCDSNGSWQSDKFVALAAPGDSVRKASGNDTLYLLKNRRVYPFIAEKPR